MKKNTLPIVILVMFLTMSYLLMFTASTPNNLEKELDIRKLIEEKEKNLRKLQNKPSVKNPEWKAEVVSERLIKTFEGENYVVEFYEVTFRIQKPKLEELIGSNKEYFDFLIKNLGERGREIVKETISKWEKWISSGNSTYEIKTKTVKVSSKLNGSIKFDSNIYNIVSYGYYPSDPVNLVFYGPAGSAQNVQYDMKYWLNNKWNDTLGNTLYAIIDKDHTDDKDWIVKGQDCQLRYGDFWSKSYHIRIYDGGYDWDQYLEWSIAGVHYEQWEWFPPGHKIISWEDAEQFVRSDFSGKWFVGSVWSWWLGNAEYYQDKWNDGYATAIELKH
ncbi:MAG: hypothetical protein ACPLRT_05190 [Thermoproteota archaeon]